MKSYNIIIAFICLIFTGCVKEIVEDQTTTVELPKKEKTTTSFYGTVTDDSGDPLAGAEIAIANATSNASITTTDSEGNYSFLDESIFGKNLNLKVSAPGMWSYHKTVEITQGGIKKINLVCSPKKLTTTLKSDEGGVAEVSDDISITFEPNSFDFETEAGGNEDISIYARLVARNDNLLENGFGMTDGVNKDGDLVKVFPQSVLQLEMVDKNGQEVKLKEGKTAEIKLKNIFEPSSGEIKKTFMHYNSTLNIWDEEQDIEETDGYIYAHVSHFSDWSLCYITSLAIELSGKLEVYDSEGKLVQTPHYVLLTYPFLRNVLRTEADGTFYTSFAIKDLPFELSVLNECEEVLFTEDRPPFTGDTELETITVNAEGLDYRTISFNVMSCDSTWVDKGIARLDYASLEFKYVDYLPVTDGHVEFSIPSCDGTDYSGELFLLDEENRKTTDPIALNLSASYLGIDTIMLCDTFKNSLITYINGNLYTQDLLISHGYIADTDGSGDIWNIIQSLLCSSVSLQVDGKWDAGETIDVKALYVKSDISTDYYRCITDCGNDLKMVIEEFIPGENYDEFPGAYPIKLIGKVTGTISKYDENDVYIGEDDIVIDVHIDNM